MATVPLVSVEEYLRTSYRPDCDYVDGVLLERNVGQFEHSNLQTLLAALFVQNRAKWRVIGLVEQRVQVRPGKYRVPDLLAVPLDYDRAPVVTQPPLLCIEIVSPDDRLPGLTERARDYAALGVPQTWILDPETRLAHVYTASNGLTEVQPAAVLRCGEIELDVAALFSSTR